LLPENILSSRENSQTTFHNELLPMPLPTRNFLYFICTLESGRKFYPTNKQTNKCYSLQTPMLLVVLWWFSVQNWGTTDGKKTIDRSLDYLCH
jgi:hypothetical protein